MWTQWVRRLFQNYPDQFKDELILEMESINYRRARIISGALVFISVAMYLVATAVDDLPFISEVNLSFVLLSVINAVLFQIKVPKTKALHPYHRVIISFEILVAVGWSSTLLAFVPNRYELFGTYSIIILSVSALFFLRWQINLLFISLSTFYVIPIALNYLTPPILPKITVVVSSLIVSWIISRLLYVNQSQNFVSEKLLEQQRNNFKQEVILQTEKLVGYEERTTKEMITAFIKLLDIHEHYTNGHSAKVASLAEKIAIEMQLSFEEIKAAYWSGMVHDVGKLMIPTEILNKEGPLKDEEYDLIKQHPIWGFEALFNVQSLHEIALNILYHHERWDGKGYPDGLKGEEIPCIAQILAVADVWDAMTTDRPYHKALSKKEAVTELQRCRGTQCSPVVIDAFMRMIKNKKIQ
jgi:HD-GYP domain-containing protein (c-di-GMP phosphodiesterase class II)